MSLIHPSVDVKSIVEAVLPRYFTYQRGQLGPARVFLTLMHMRIFGQRGYRRVFDELQGGLAHRLGWLWDDKPTSAALCKARPKLSIDQCETAFRAVYDHCSLAREHAEFTYRGRRVVSFDGTRLALPNSPELERDFGRASNQSGESATPIAGMVMLWDVSAQQPIAFNLAPYRHCERTLARELFDHVPEDSVVVTDRGFPSFDLWEDLCDRKQGFLSRIKKSAWNCVRSFSESDETDTIIQVPVPRKYGQKTGRKEPLPIRFLKVPLPSGETEILATNLFAEDGNNADELSRLYCTRWRIETAFREMKIWHAMENFSAKHTLGIHQEIYAIFTFALLASDMEARVRIEKQHLQEQNPDEPLPTIRYNRLLIADAVVGLLVAATAGREQVDKHLQRCIESIWRNREKRRPRRTAPRRNRMGKKR